MNNNTNFQDTCEFSKTNSYGEFYFHNRKNHYKYLEIHNVLAKELQPNC